MTFKIFPMTVVLALCLVASARPQNRLQAPGPWVIGAVNDWASSGNYQIYSCSSQASEVKNLLDSTYLYVQTAILSTDAPAYKAFFHSVDPALVKTVLRAITAGTNITTKDHGSRRPTLVCVNPNDWGIAPFWKLCEDPSEPAMVIQPPESSIIFLCPVYFERAMSPDADKCGTVNHAGTRMIVHSYIAGTQYGLLVQALSNMYVRETMPGVIMLGERARTENECLALPPDQALRSSANYAYFLSNVRAGCTDFPSKVPIQRDRELLETDEPVGSNGTGIITVGCGSNGANSSSCSL